MTNPFFNRGPILEARFYLPRPYETREAMRLVAGSQNCALVGPIKSGKTSLLLHLARPATMARHGLASTKHSAVYLSFEGLGRVSQEQFFHLMLREMARQASGRTAVVWPRFEARDGVSFLELKEALDQIEAAGEHLVLLLDELETAATNPAFDLNFFSALRHIAARPGICFVTATDRPLHEMEVAGRAIGSPFADLFSVVRLRWLGTDTVWQWLTSLSNEAGVDLGPEREFISALSDGSLYHAQVAAYEAFDCKKTSAALTEDERRYVALRAYEQVEPVLTMMWDRLRGSEKDTALAALQGDASAEVDGFTTLSAGRAVIANGLVERFLSGRQRDGGTIAAQALDSADADRDMMYGVVRVLMRAIEARDRSARPHADQVVRLATAIAREMGCSDEVAEGVRVASRVHDIGKVSISDTILLKPSPLSELEREIVQTHPIVGAQILDALEFPWVVKPAVRYHHERLDGSGYPEGLMGEEIPLTARILAVADVMAAMTADRPYRSAVSAEEALAELRDSAGQQYDAAVVEALARVAGAV